MPAYEPSSFRFLDLPAELRNRVYNFAAIGNDEPTKLLNVRKHPDFTVPSESVKTMAYRMGLAQACKQIRAEYLPIYARKAKVAICWHDLHAFQDAFYQQDRYGASSPAHLTINVCSTFAPYGLCNILPILRVCVVDPLFACRFVPDKTCTREGVENRGFQMTDPECLAPTEFLKLDDEAWCEELKNGTFSKVDIHFMHEYGGHDIGLELSTPLAQDEGYNRIEEHRLRGILEIITYTFCGLYQEDDGMYEHYAWFNSQ